MFLTCAQLAANLSALEDGEVSAVRRAEAAVHLSWCRECQAYVAQFRALRTALAASSSSSSPPTTTAPASATLAAFHEWQPGGVDSDVDSDDDDLGDVDSGDDDLGNVGNDDEGPLP